MVVDVGVDVDVVVDVDVDGFSPVAGSFFPQPWTHRLHLSPRIRLTLPLAIPRLEISRTGLPGVQVDRAIAILGGSLEQAERVTRSCRPQNLNWVIPAEGTQDGRLCRRRHTVGAFFFLR